VIAVYLTILIANMGGYVDQIQRGQIQENISMQLALNPAFKSLSAAEKKAQMEAQTIIQEKRLGLDRPFAVRSFLYLRNALSLDLGRALQMASDSGSKMVKNIILERLPPTLVLFGTADVFLFILAITIALSLSRKYGSIFDKFFIALTPTSSAPGWFMVFSDLIRCFATLAAFGGWWMHTPDRSDICFVC
jgi:peptide/nickel transport system permease protein